MYTSIVISQPSPSRKITPFQKRLESKEEAIGCTRTMMAQLQKILDCLQPADAKTTDAISSETEQSVRSLRATFERLCNAVGMHLDAEKLPDVKKKAQDSSMIGLFPRGPRSDDKALPKAPPKKEPKAAEKAAKPKRVAQKKRKDLHLSKVGWSLIKVMSGTTRNARVRRGEFDDGMKIGCRKYGIDVPQLDFDDMRYYIEDMEEMRTKHPEKSSYWLSGYAVAKFEKRNAADEQ